MEKKAGWITLIVLSVLFVIQIPFNFLNNAYYYATHTHYKENQYPFITLLNTNYLPANYVSNYIVENDDKRGSYIVTINKKRIETNSDIIEVSDTYIFFSKDYRDRNYYLNNNASFSFTEHGTINGYYRRGNPPKNAKKEIIYALDQIQSEIKQNSEKPLINIQWIWDFWFKIH